jgi:hypothetical protein
MEYKAAPSPREPGDRLGMMNCCQSAGRILAKPEKKPKEYEIFF